MRTILAVAAALLAGSAEAQLPVETAADQPALLTSTDPQLAANKRLVFDFWREVVQAHNVERAPDFVAESYVEHNPNVPTGRAGFMRFFGRSPKEPVKPTIDDLVTIVAERDLVVLGFRRELGDLANEGQTYTTTWFEMFRIEDGRVAEHWDFGTQE